MLILNSIIGFVLCITNCLLLLGLKKFFKLAKIKTNNNINYSRKGVNK